MSKRLLSWKKSQKKSDIATDAVVLQENDQNVGDSERTQSNALSIPSLSPEMRFPQHFDSRDMSLMRPNGSLVESPNTNNNALSYSNTQNNFYQLSHMSGVVIGTSILINNGNNGKQSSDRRSRRSHSGEIQKTTSIDAMMRSNEPVNEKVMDVISTHLGENWRSLFRSLDFSDGQIDQMKEDYHINGVKEVIYRLLLDYSRNNDDASLGHITQLMWKLGFRECVSILKTHWKTGDFAKIETNKSNTKAGCTKGKSVD